MREIDRVPSTHRTSVASQRALDEQYAAGYAQTPEDTTDLEALLPHLPADEWPEESGQRSRIDG